MAAQAKANPGGPYHGLKFLVLPAGPGEQGNEFEYRPGLIRFKFHVTKIILYFILRTWLLIDLSENKAQ